MWKKKSSFERTLTFARSHLHNTLANLCALATATSPHLHIRRDVLKYFTCRGTAGVRAGTLPRKCSESQWSLVARDFLALAKAELLNFFLMRLALNVNYYTKCIIIDQALAYQQHGFGSRRPHAFQSQWQCKYISVYIYIDFKKHITSTSSLISMVLSRFLCIYIV